MTSAFAKFRYYALVYFTVTGEVIDEIPLAGVPQWMTKINDTGSWTIQTQIGTDTFDSGGCLSKQHLREITDPWRHSVAICWGTGSRSDYIVQAGPITSRANLQSGAGQPPLLQIGGLGPWGVLLKTMQLASSWPGVSLTQPGGADTNYTDSLWGIATDILTNAVARNPIPLDIPTFAGGGTNVRNYFGYDLATAGQRLQELTQVIGGPDVYLKPYFFDNNHIHHNVLIGQPMLVTSGNPIVFDYPGSIKQILESLDGSNQATTTFEKGDGIEYAMLWAQSIDTTLTNAGWPKLETTDNSHSDVVLQATLQEWADGQQQLNGIGVTTYAITVKMDDPDTPFGSFDPGSPGIYNVRGHAWLPDGELQQRIIGLQQGQQDFEYVHLVGT
jgi:hypothetical protein